MATYRAKDATITVGSAIGKMRTATITKTTSTMEDTGSGDDWRTRKPGYKDWSMQGTFVFQDNFPSLGNEATVSFEVNSSADEAAWLGSGAGIVTECTLTGDHENVHEFNITVEGNGALTET